MKNVDKNLFGSTRWKLDLIAAFFIASILFLFSFAIYRLLTVDIIYQITGIFNKDVNETDIFESFIEQTIFLLVLADIIIFTLSMFLFDKLVQRLLAPIEYLSNIQKKFAENLSHELRTPLAIINMNSEIILNKIEKEEKIINDKKLKDSFKSGILNIKNEVNSITNLIDDLLFEARIKYSEDKIEKIKVSSLENIFKKAVDDLSDLVQENVNVVFENKIEDRFLKSSFDGNILHFERILNNLLSNSFKYTRNGSVKIILENYRASQKDYLRFLVKDSGIGIKRVDIDKVGDRFFRGGNIENEIAGTGIGMAIVKDLIKKYNWSFEIESEENVGTKVSVEKILLN